MLYSHCVFLFISVYLLFVFIQGSYFDMLEIILPTTYPYVILNSSLVSADNFQCEIRAKIDSQEDFFRWLKEFESNTNSSWILRNSVPLSEISRYRFLRNYLCQHAQYRKKEDGTKNKNCCASLTVRIKRESRFIRCRDPYAKDGYMSLIKINFKHSHEVNAPEAWNWLPRSEETKNIFLALFDAGFTPAAAIRFHKTNILSENYSEDVINSRIDPPMRWVYRLHNKWSLQNSEENTTDCSLIMDAKNRVSEDIQEKIKTFIVDESQFYKTLVFSPSCSQMDSVSSCSSTSSHFDSSCSNLNAKCHSIGGASDNLPDNTICKIENAFQNIVSILKNNKNDKSLISLAGQYLKQLENINSSSQLHSFLSNSLPNSQDECEQKTSIKAMTLSGTKKDSDDVHSFSSGPCIVSLKVSK